MSSDYVNTSTVARAYRYGTVVTGNRYIDDFLTPRITLLSGGKRSISMPVIDIERIPFNVTKEEGQYVLSNQQWPSLISSGSSLSEAIANTLELIHTVFSEYIYEAEDNLSVDAIEFRQFLLSKISR